MVLVIHHNSRHCMTALTFDFTFPQSCLFLVLCGSYKREDDRLGVARMADFKNGELPSDSGIPVHKEEMYKVHFRVYAMLVYDRIAGTYRLYVNKMYKVYHAKKPYQKDADIPHYDFSISKLVCFPALCVCYLLFVVAFVPAWRCQRSLIIVITRYDALACQQQVPLLSSGKWMPWPGVSRSRVSSVQGDNQGYHWSLAQGKMLHSQPHGCNECAGVWLRFSVLHREAACNSAGSEFKPRHGRYEYGRHACAGAETKELRSA